MIASQPPSVLSATSSVHETDSETETDIKSPLQCIVKILLSLYASLSAHDSNQLRARLADRATQLIFQSWALSQRSLILTMVHICNIVYTITVALDCSCLLSVGHHQIKAFNSHLLNGVPRILTCVDHIVNFMSLLEQSMVCGGNADPKVMGLLDHHKGAFKNKSG